MKKKILHSTIILFLYFILQSCNFKNSAIKQSEIKNDSIFLWVKSSKNTSFSITERKFFLKKSYNVIQSNKMDTTAIRSLSKIAYQYLILKDITRFKELNEEACQLALKLKDTFALADINWNNANFYKKIEVYDSAYYHYNKAYKYFESIDQQNYAAKMLYGMSFIKGRYRDYSGSEVLIIKAISKYKLLKKNEALYASYNLLALLQNDIKEFDRALFYHNKAFEYLNKLKNKKDFSEISLNNIGNVYIEKGEYPKALRYFNKILEDDSLQIKNIERYAKVIDNRSYCKLLNKDTINIKQDFYASLKIRDSINNKGGIVISKIHLAEFFKIAKDSIKALAYAKEANALAKEIRNSRDYLASLKLLSELDEKEAKGYLEKYIKYYDSLQDFDRKTQNKFTRIAYETDEYIEETKLLSHQKMRVLIIGLGGLLIISLIYYLRIQKTQNEKLLLEALQQKANEQIYVLTIKQQSKLEEEKTKERNRISEELHDSILGNLFGVRVGLGFLDIQGDSNTLKEHQIFLDELQDIEKEIREVSHKLNSNFSSSEINFNAILNQLLINKSNVGGFTYHLTLCEDIVWEKIGEAIKVNLFRIIQEALQNIVNYAKTENVVLDFSIIQENLVVSITDNGVGFNIKRAKKGIGIKNMKSRIQKLNGIFSIHSEINKGTTIHFTIPLQ